MLVADGDRMGAAISEIGDMKGHQDFSSTLSEFAGKAKKVVESFHGVCVYTGGDDVLAFLPLDTCLGSSTSPSTKNFTLGAESGTNDDNKQK